MWERTGTGIRPGDFNTELVSSPCRPTPNFLVLNRAGTPDKHFLGISDGKFVSPGCLPMLSIELHLTNQCLPI
ncbi:hypothetical protein SAMN05216553_11261 [Lentzea fradiae]|uniref:Uncharacterized protein n=1 Tax=Lentzea fradiae TaxID=200378 RepID=A0A1G7XK09_9PSEU|nr:hypothetical protein [Lentzea fradiae]SDG84507.1 hypothetical protein SAMN05216553_11261 [Lentzea fradiae]